MRVLVGLLPAPGGELGGEWVGGWGGGVGRWRGGVKKDYCHTPALQP